jgi:hypothetical protein
VRVTGKYVVVWKKQTERPVESRRRHLQYRSIVRACPTAETLERFIALVERNAHVEAIETFYAPSASMQENQAAPASRQGQPHGERAPRSREGEDGDLGCIRPCSSTATAS